MTTESIFERHLIRAKVPFDGNVQTLNFVATLRVMEVIL